MSVMLTRMEEAIRLKKRNLETGAAVKPEASMFAGGGIGRDGDSKVCCLGFWAEGQLSIPTSKCS